MVFSLISFSLNIDYRVTRVMDWLYGYNMDFSFQVLVAFVKIWL